MSSPELEGFLARLYTDEPTLAEFLRRLPRLLGLQA
jgi:hypothetical protein